MKTKKAPRVVVVNRITNHYVIFAGNRKAAIPASPRAAPHVAAILRLRGVKVTEITADAPTAGSLLDADIAKLKADLAAIAAQREQVATEPLTAVALSIPRAAEALGVSFGRISYWVQKGEIKFTDGMVNGRPAKLIPPEEITRLAAQFARAS